MGIQQLPIQGIKLWLWALTALASSVCIGQAQGPARVGNDEVQSKQCGPPEYCARTDRRVEPYPEKPPTMGAAGSIIKDPTFGSRIVRATDSKSDPKRGGGPLYTPSSAEQNAWNKNSTMFYVSTSGGSFLLYDFDSTTMTPHLARNPNLDWGGEPQFSLHQINLLYGMNRSKPLLEQYDTSTGRVSEVNDPSKCIKVGTGDFGRDLTVSADDNRFMTVLGPRQDESDMVYIYDRTQGCRWYNTQTGEVGGQWGPQGTVSLPDRFLLHNARMAKSGKFIYLVRAGGGVAVGHRWVVWDIDSLNISVCPEGCSGHHVLGYSHIFGPSGRVHPLELWLRPLNHLENSISVIDGLQTYKGPWFDSHFSWNDADPNDSTPVCFSTYEPSKPDQPNAVPPVTQPWENEIDCVETDGKAFKVWRFAHTYSSARNGFWSSPRGNVSQDGRFFMFTSDWEEQLGKMPQDGKFRTDVFIVELR